MIPIYLNLIALVSGGFAANAAPPIKFWVNAGYVNQANETSHPLSDKYETYKVSLPESPFECTAEISNGSRTRSVYIKCEHKKSKVYQITVGTCDLESPNLDLAGEDAANLAFGEGDKQYSISLKCARNSPKKALEEFYKKAAEEIRKKNGN